VRREQSKEGMMDGWNGMDFVRKVSTSMAKGKKIRVGITLLQ
jgi:hypothetical protein